MTKKPQALATREQAMAYMLAAWPTLKRTHNRKKARAEGLAAVRQQRKREVRNAETLPEISMTALWSDTYDIDV